MPTTSRGLDINDKIGLEGSIKAALEYVKNDGGNSVEFKGTNPNTLFSWSIAISKSNDDKSFYNSSIKLSSPESSGPTIDFYIKLNSYINSKIEELKINSYKVSIDYDPFISMIYYVENLEYLLNEIIVYIENL